MYVPVSGMFVESLSLRIITDDVVGDQTPWIGSKSGSVYNLDGYSVSMSSPKIDDTISHRTGIERKN